MPRPLHESEIEREEAEDRWSSDLVGGSSPLETSSGFSLGVAEYFLEEFGERQVHEDQEAVYVVSGVGEMLVGEETFPVRPGTAVYIPPGTVHSTRRTGRDPVRVVYAHGAV